MADNELLIKLLADAKSLVSGFKEGETSVDKLKLAITSLEATNKQLQKAEENLVKARESGDAKAIKSAEKQLESKSKIVIQAEKEVEREIKAVERIIAAEEKKQAAVEKASQKNQQSREKELASLDKLSKDINEKISQASTRSLSQLNDGFVKLFESVGKGELPIHQLESAITSLGSKFGVVGIASAQLINGIIGSTEAIAEFTEKANEAAKLQRLFADISGLKPETLESFELAAKSIGGTTVQVIQLTDRFAALINKAKEGGKEGETAAKVLEKLKIPVADLNKPLNDLFEQALGGFNSLEAGAEKAEVSFKAFGLRASKTFSELSQNAKEFKEIIKNSGVLFDEKQQEDLKRYSLATLELKTTIEGIVRQVGAEFAPILTDLAIQGKQAIEAIKADPATIEGLKKLFETFEQLVIVLGGGAIDLFKDLTKVIGNLGLALDALQSPLETARKLFDAFRDGQIKALNATELISVATGNFTPIIDRLRVLAEAKAKADKEAAEATKKHTEEIEKQKFTLEDQENALRKAKNALEEYTRANKLSTEEIKSSSEDRITAIKDEIDQEKTGRIAGAKEILAEKQKTNAELINLAQKLVEETEARARETVELTKEAENAKIALIKLTTQVKRDEEKAKQEIEKATLATIKENNEIAKNTRITKANEALEKINELEKESDQKHEERAKERAQITKKLILDEIEDIKKIVDNAEVGEKARGEARKTLSKLTAELSAQDLKSQKDVNAAILKDTEEKNKAKIASDKAVADAAKKESERKEALADLEKSKEKLAFEQRIAKLKESGATAEQIALETANFEIEQQKKVIEAIKIKIQVQKAANGDNKELSKELIKLEDDLVKAQAQLNKLTADRTEILKKQKTIQSEIKLDAQAGNDAFAKAIDEHGKSVQKAGERIGSAAAIIADSKQKIFSGGEYINSQTASIEDLTAAIDELREHAKVIDLTFAFPGKDVVVADINASADKLQQELIARTQRVELEAAQKRAEEALQVEREKQQHLAEINQDRLNQLLEAEKDFEKQKQKLAEETEKENIEFVAKEKERNDKLNADKLKASEDFAKKESEIQENLAKQEEERLRHLAETKEKLQLDSADKLNSLLRKDLVDRATLEAQINAEKDPKKKAELEKQLTEVTTKARKEETREKAKQAELDKLLTENLTEDELKARQDAIERKYKLEQDADEQRQALIKSGNQKELEAFEKLVKEQEIRDKERLAKELQRIKEAAKRKEDQEKEERVKRLADYNQRIKDLEDSFKKERDAAQTAHDKRLNDIKEQQKQIKKEYIATQEEITKKAIDSAAQIGVTGKAIQDAFGLANEAAQKYLSTLGQIGQAQGGIASGSSTSSSSSPTSTSSSSGSGGGIGNNTAGLGQAGGSNPFGRSASSDSSTSTSQTSSSTQGKGIEQAPKGNGGQTGIPKKDKSDDVPSVSANDAKSYSDSAFKLLDKWEKSDKKDVYNGKLNSKLYELGVTYAGTLKNIDAKAKDNLLLFAPQNVRFVNDPKDNRKKFTEDINQFIVKVEGLRAKESKGATKTDVASDIPTKSGDIITPGLSSDPKGGTKGDTASSGFEGTKDPGTITSGQPTKDPVLAARDAALDTGYEGEGAESRSAQAERAAMKAAKDQNAGIQANIPITVPVTVVNQMSAEQIDRAVMQAIAKALQDQGIGRQVTNTVNGNNTQSNFNRNPAKFIAK